MDYFKLSKKIDISVLSKFMISERKDDSLTVLNIEFHKNLLFLITQEKIGMLANVVEILDLQSEKFKLIEICYLKDVPKQTLNPFFRFLHQKNSIIYL